MGNGVGTVSVAYRKVDSNDFFVFFYCRFVFVPVSASQRSFHVNIIFYHVPCFLPLLVADSQVPPSFPAFLPSLPCCAPQALLLFQVQLYLLLFPPELQVFQSIFNESSRTTTYIASIPIPNSKFKSHARPHFYIFLSSSPSSSSSSSSSSSFRVSTVV